MDISWLGHSCFRIKGKEVLLITDPYHPNLGYALNKLQADIVTLSHFHPGHSYIASIINGFKVINGPGEYEIKDTFITGIASFHDAEQGNKLGKNTIYVIELEGIKICHLGDLGHLPDSEQMESLSDVDVLFLPVGGGNTIAGVTAAEIVRHLSPKFAIPMHYKISTLTRELEPPDRFFKELGIREVVSQSRLSVNRSTLSADSTKVIVLDYPHQ